MSGLCPELRRRGDLFQQLAGALPDERRLVVGNVVTVQERALNSFIDADEIADFSSNVVHDEFPSRDAQCP